MVRIQVLIAGMPQLLADVIRATLLQQPDMQLVEENRAVNDLFPAARADVPDVLIVGLNGGGIPTFCGPMLYGNPRLKVLAVSTTGEDTALYELRPHRIALGNVTPGGLVEAIRGSFEERP